MNLDSWHEVDRTALRAFYEAGQGWSWKDIADGTSLSDRRVRDWIESCPPPRGHPVVLPVLSVGQTEAQWFAIAFSEAQGDELREHLNAFVGPAGSDYLGRRANISTDSLAMAAAAWAGGPWIFRFTPLPQFRQQVRKALGRMRQMWRLRPTERTSVFRSVEGTLREFFSALSNHDETASRHWLDEVRASGRLSAENLHFLEIERLGVFEHWDQIALHPHLSMVVAMRRPRRITAFLIEALWHSELAVFVQGNHAADAVVYFREKFLPRYEGLLRSRGSLSQTPVVLTFLLAAVAMDPPRRNQVPILLAVLPTDAPERAFAETVAAQLSIIPVATVPIDALTLARQAIANKDFDTAWLHLQSTPASVDSCELRLDCAAELASVEVARVVADALGQLRPDQLAAVLRVRRHARTWQDLESILTPHGQVAPQNWETWFDAVDFDPAWHRALEVAHEGVSEWPVDIYRRNPARVKSVADRLQAARGPEASLLVRLALPHLARFFLPESTGEAVFRPVYQAMLLVLALDDRFGGEDWLTAQNLAVAILDSGASPDDYQDAVEALRSIWQNHGEISRLDWALDLLETLVVAPAPVPTARDAYFTVVWQTFSAHMRRVRQEHLKVLALLCQDLNRSADFAALPNLPSEDATQETARFHEQLNGKLIAIYTLTESAGTRAKIIVESLFCGVDVRLNHDHGGSDRLRSLAREADYFLVAASSAKHAATEFIKAERPKGLHPLIYPAGKGSSSLVRALCVELSDAA